MKMTEYDVSFAAKEFLLENGYTIVTWNPPGSQGTFTIPNPNKDPKYKGQTGSESPDLIAFKENELLILEAKDSVKKCIGDIEKIKNLLGNAARKELLFNICNRQMEALGIEFDAYKCFVVLGIAVPVFCDTDEIKARFPDIRFYFADLKNKNWNGKVIENISSVDNAFEVVVK